MESKSEDQGKFITREEFKKFQQSTANTVAELISRIVRLETPQAEEDDVINTVFLQDAKVPPAAPGRGRKSKLPLNQLLSQRDWLVQIVEQHCPEVVDGLQKARDGAEALGAIIGIEEIANYPVKPFLLQVPNQCAGQLWSFLRSGRFHDNLHNLANAMAGVPEIGWKRSFDLCTANPYNAPIAMNCRAYRNYLQRNFPQRLRELDSAQTTEEVVKILAKSRSKAPIYRKLKESPERVLDWMRDGMVRGVR